MLFGLVLSGRASDQESSPASSPSPTSATSATPYPTPKLATFKERLAAAESVKVQTDLLGLEMGMSVEAAHRKLDPLSDPAKPFVEEGGKDEDGQEKQGEEQHRVVWQLAKSDFSSIYIKADRADRIEYISGVLRPGKEIPFVKIGQVEKAPISSENNVVWDMVRPKKPLIRVVARGENGRASSLTIFVVRRPKL